MRSYFVRTDEGMEVVHDVVEMRPCKVSNFGVEEPMFQVMFEDSKENEGTFCYDYVPVDTTVQEYQEFIYRNLDW